jgi:glutamate-1-semialdehyde 2,1-aminomutase
MPVAERIEFCAAGQEANMMAIRLARLFTGRTRILRFANSYHGWADELSAVGQVGCVNECVTEIPFNDLRALERELETGEYAMVISEGGGARMAGRVPINLEFQRALPDLVCKYETLYCIDEVVTGFRDAPGGWQELVGVRPDLATIGKCAGGGMPFGAVVGRADVFAPLRPDAPSAKSIHHAGTWNASPVTAAAGVAACSLYIDGTPQREAQSVARRFRDDANEVLQRLGISGCLYGRSIVHLYLGPVRPDVFDLDYEGPSVNPAELMSARFDSAQQRLGLHLLQRGVATLQGSMFVFSAAHTGNDVVQTLEALESSLDAMLAEGSIPPSLCQA